MSRLLTSSLLALSGLVDAQGRPLESEVSEEKDPTEIGLAELLKHDPYPEGSPCSCGAPIPWSKVRATAADPRVEIEVRHHCGALYVLRAGRAWRWTT